MRALMLRAMLALAATGNGLYDGSCRIRYKRWRNGGWRWLPKKTLYHGLVNLIGLIPSLASRNESLRESCIREKRTCSLSGGRRPARKRTSSDPTPMNHSNKDRRSLAESEEGRPSIKENAGQPNTYPTQSGKGVPQGWQACGKQRVKIRTSGGLEEDGFERVRSAARYTRRPAQFGEESPRSIRVHYTFPWMLYHIFGAIPGTRIEWLTDNLLTRKNAVLLKLLGS